MAQEFQNMKILHVQDSEVELVGTKSQVQNRTMMELSGITSLSFGDDDELELEFTLTNSPRNKELITLDLTLAGQKVTTEIMNYDFMLEDEDEFPPLYWKTRFIQHNFCVFQLKIYDANDKCSLTKYIHVSQEEGPQCGCSLDDDGDCCSDIEEQPDPLDGEQYHQLEFNMTYDSFCTVDQLSRLCRMSTKMKQPSSSSHPVGLKLELEVQGFIGVKKKSSTRKVPPRPLKWNATMSDVKFRLASGETIDTHKFVLADRSPVFKEIFESSTIEAQSGEIVVDDLSVTKDDVKTFVQMLYGTMNQELVHDDLSSVIRKLKLAHFYKVEVLMDLLMRSIIGRPNSSLDMESALLIYSAGCQYQIDCLKFRCLQWMRVNRLVIQRQGKKKVETCLNNTSLTDLDKKTLLAFIFPTRRRKQGPGLTRPGPASAKRARVSTFPISDEDDL